MGKKEMRYYKHNRNRSFDARFYNGRRSFKKLMYMLDSNRTRLLDSGYFESQTWGALHKAWKRYVIAKNKYEFERMEYYASVIQKLQKELGLTISSFPELGLIPQPYGETYDDEESAEVTD